jgi:hypothetical protein
VKQRIRKPSFWNGGDGTVSIFGALDLMCDTASACYPRHHISSRNNPDHNPRARVGSVGPGAGSDETAGAPRSQNERGDWIPILIVALRDALFRFRNLSGHAEVTASLWAQCFSWLGP